MNEKLVVITRGDLTLAQQAVQSGHAAIDFVFEHNDRAGPWHTDSNYLIYLEAKDEAHLGELISKFQMCDLKFTVFREPDLNDSITSVAVEPSDLTQKLTKKLPLLFKNKSIQL